jgi:hypothetical protein
LSDEVERILSTRRPPADIGLTARPRHASEPPIRRKSSGQLPRVVIEEQPAPIPDEVGDEPPKSDRS